MILELMFVYQLVDGWIDAISNLLQGTVSVADIIGSSGSETISSKPDGLYMIFSVL